MKSYITTDNFFNNLRTYQTQANSTTYATEGRLTTPGTVAGVTTVAIVNVKTKVNLVRADCPAGRILRETGRRLYPGQNPGLNVGDKYNGAVVGTTATQTMWVMVYDVMTGISAFINPNDTVFAVYSADKPLELINPLEGSASVLGAPVISGGLVTAVGQIRSTGVTTIDATGLTTISIDGSAGQVFIINNIYSATGLSISASSFPVGAIIYLILNSTAAGSTSITFSTNFIGQFSRAFTAATSSRYIIQFISDGTNFYETNRSTALT
jgi:hypothetical protein